MNGIAMALSDDEIRAAYQALSEATRRCGLDWVLEQVEERITFGKTAVKKVKTVAVFARGGSDEFATLVDPLAPGPAGQPRHSSSLTGTLQPRVSNYWLMPCSWPSRLSTRPLGTC